jgi:hypothetical protein
VRFVELLADVDVTFVRSGPAQVEVAQWCGLVEAQHTLTEQLEHREKPRHRGDDIGIGGQSTECRAALTAESIDDQMGLFANAHPGGVEVGQ